MNKQQATLRKRILPQFEKLDCDPARPLAVVVMECAGKLNATKLRKRLHRIYQQVDDGYGFGGVCGNAEAIQKSFYFCAGTKEEVARFTAIGIQAGRLLDVWAEQFISSAASSTPDALQNWIRVVCELACSDHSEFPIRADRTFWPQAPTIELDLESLGPWLQPIQQETDPEGLHSILIDVVQASIYATDILTVESTNTVIDTVQHCPSSVSSKSKLRSGVDNEAVDVWRRKLEYLQQQEAIASDPAQKFTIREQIEETKTHIAALEADLPVSETTSDVVARISECKGKLQQFIDNSHKIQDERTLLRWVTSLGAFLRTAVRDEARERVMCDLRGIGKLSPSQRRSRVASARNSLAGLIVSLTEEDFRRSRN